MTDRHRLANRRALETIAIQHEGQRFKVGLGRELICIDRGAPEQASACEPSRTAQTEELGPVVEIWLNAQKVNSPIDVLASDGAILMSMLIQYGCPAGEIVKSMKHNSDGTPASPLGVAATFLKHATQPGD